MKLTDMLTTELACLSRPIRVVETGSIRIDDETIRDDDGWSTLWFALQGDVLLHTIDLDVSVAQRVLDRHSVKERVTFLQGHSIGRLAELIASQGASSFDVAFLDSGNSPELILHEFLIALVLVRSGGMILIDDVAIKAKPHTGGHKGTAVIEYLQQCHLPYSLIERSGPKYSTGVLRYSRP